MSTVVFLHGAGEGPSAWDGVLAAMPSRFDCLAVDYVDPVFTFDAGVANALAALDAQGISRAHFVGLSLGSMTAALIAAHHPERVDHLVLSAGQVRAPRAYMAVQNTLFRAMPAAWLRPKTASKPNMVTVFDAVARADLRPSLGRIVAPTLALCGQWDLPSLGASRAFARGIPGAQRAVVPGAFHAWHHTMLEEFARRVVEFVEG